MLYREQQFCVTLELHHLLVGQQTLLLVQVLDVHLRFLDMEREVSRENAKVFLDLVARDFRQLDELVYQNARLIVNDFCVLVFYFNFVVLRSCLGQKRVVSHGLYTAILILAR